jgi:SAM-dependent MidA family methyltransferase
MVAQEWLDDVPCDVVEIDAQGRPRLVLVEDDGREVLGPALDDGAGCATYDVDADAIQGWLQRWWPVALPGARAEVGLPRDGAWAGLTAQLRAGTVVAIDYGHIRSGRLAGRYDAGTLSAYASGRQVDAVPDGRCDITAHVAMDACAAAGRVGSDAVTLTRQRDALSELGVRGTLPPREQAVVDPAAYADALQCASQGAELRDRAGLGAFWWLRVDRAAALTAAAAPTGWSGPGPGPSSPAGPGPGPAPGPAPRPGAAPPP